MTKNPINKTFLIRLLLVAIFSFFGFFALRDVYSLASKSYLIDANKLVRLDTLELLNRAFKYSGSKGSSARFEFESTDRHSFRISGERFLAITDINKLTDTLMYHGTKFLAYTDEAGVKDYKDNSKSSIEVYQFLVDGEKYIDISRTNQLSYNKLIRAMFLWVGLIGVVLFGILRKTENQDYD